MIEGDCLEKAVLKELRAIFARGNSAFVKEDKNGNIAIYEVKKKVTVKSDNGSCGH